VAQQQAQQPTEIGFGQGIGAGIGGFPGTLPETFMPGNVGRAVGGYPMDVDPGFTMTGEQIAKIGSYKPGGNPMDYANAVSGGFEAERQPIQYQPAMDAMTNRIDPNMRQSMMQPERQMNYAQVNAYAGSVKKWNVYATRDVSTVAVLRNAGAGKRTTGVD
jgi:hypothetical protein